MAIARNDTTSWVAPTREEVSNLSKAHSMGQVPSVPIRRASLTTDMAAEVVMEAGDTGEVAALGASTIRKLRWG